MTTLTTSTTSTPRSSGRSSKIVTGIVRNPRATSSSYARSSSSTLYAVNGTPSRESNAFTCSQLRQALPA